MSQDPFTEMDACADVAPREPNAGVEPAALTYREVSKAIGGRQILCDVSLELAPGQTVVVAGLNGAGKTSLIRLALDFWRPDSGEIKLFGLPSTRATARKRVSFLPERFTPTPELSGRQVLELLCGLRANRYDDEKAATILEMLDFPLEVLNKATRSYSKGMAQKLGLCAALVAETDLTILDEPFSGLDPVSRVAVLDCLRRLRSHGRTIVFTSHSLGGLDDFCDKLVVVHQGEIHYLGSPAQALTEFKKPDLESAFVQCITQPHRSYV